MLLARDYSMKRVCFRKTVKDHGLHVKTLANMEVHLHCVCGCEIGRMCCQFVARLNETYEFFCNFTAINVSCLLIL